MDGWRYRVLRTGKPAFQAEDGSYLDKLTLNDVAADDAGTYICVATNNVGYNYLETNVHIFSGEPRDLFLDFHQLDALETFVKSSVP